VNKKAAVAAAFLRWCNVSPKAVAPSPAYGQQNGQMHPYQRRSHRKKQKSARRQALFHSPKRPNEYQGHRTGTPERTAVAVPILIGAAMIAAAILLSTLVTAVSTRFVGTESPTDETVWLIDRLTGSVYKCQAAERGKASCEPDVATGSIGERGKH
jgi:hypothetical protein